MTFVTAKCLEKVISLEIMKNHYQNDHNFSYKIVTVHKPRIFEYVPEMSSKTSFLGQTLYDQSSSSNNKYYIKTAKKKIVCSAFFLDIAQAFARVWHE